MSYFTQHIFVCGRISQNFQTQNFQFVENWKKKKGNSIHKRMYYLKCFGNVHCLNSIVMINIVRIKISLFALSYFHLFASLFFRYKKNGMSGILLWFMIKATMANWKWFYNFLLFRLPTNRPNSKILHSTQKKKNN